MFDSSKSTRKLSRTKVLIILFLLVFASGYSLNGIVASKGASSTVTSTEIETTTVVMSNGSTSSIVANSATTQGNTSVSATSTASPTGGVLFTIPMSTLRNWLNLSSSSNVNFLPSGTKVPYYILTQSSPNKTLGLVYLTTDVAPASCWGYNSAIGTLVLVNTTGYIKALMIYINQDSWGYMITQAWLNTYVNRSVFEQLQFGVDAQPVTGATYSSTGIIDGVRDAGRLVVNDYQQHEPASASGLTASAAGMLILEPALNVFGSLSSDMGTQSELAIVILICLFAAAVVAFEFKSNKMRYGVSILSIVFMGFYAVRMVTIGDFVDFIKRFFPPISRDPYFYVLYGGVIVTSLIWGRLYCGYLCPFGVFTDFINKLSPIKLIVPYKYRSKLRYAKYVILALVVYEILEGTVLYQVEPFGTLFLLRGTELAWIFLGLILVASIFVNRFYCTYICPAGAALALLGWLRIREIKRWPECSKCMICANQCIPQAIKGDRISAFECMNCRGCEKLYLNSKLCPHYALERAEAKRHQGNSEVEVFPKAQSH